MSARIIKVCFYGPESTGKSSLAEKLARDYKTELVPEVAKEIIASNEFTVDEIIRIGREQTERVRLKERIANRIVICDTDLITTQIYSRVYLGVVPEELLDLEKQVVYDQYFLFDIDVAWVPDGLRDLGDRRKEMYLIFKEELEKRSIPYVAVNGDHARRETLVRKHIDQMLAKS